MANPQFRGEDGSGDDITRSVLLQLVAEQELGGKLGLQTHAFFGSVRACHAGTRGIDIAEVLAAEEPAGNANRAAGEE